MSNSSHHKLPLVTCIMPTAGRPQYVLRAIEYFLAQDYPAKELIIVYNRDTDMPSCDGGLPYLYPHNIKPVQVQSKILGAKRNEACRLAQGAIIAQWDDDDIYSTDRLTLQAMPILRGEADVTGLKHFAFFDISTGKSWMPTQNLFNEIYVGDVHGGSLVYNRQVWEQLANYPNLSSAEDAGFLRTAMRRGARVKALNGFNSFVYVRHNSNTWQFEASDFKGYPGWQQTYLPQFAQPLAVSHAQLAVHPKQKMNFYV